MLGALLHVLEPQTAQWMRNDEERQVRHAENPGLGLRKAYERFGADYD